VVALVVAGLALASLVGPADSVEEGAAMVQNRRDAGQEAADINA
jgi:hypothetical protein